MSAGQADVSDADSHVSVKAKLSMCLDNIRPERTAYLRWTELRFLEVVRMFSNIFGPGFIETSPARRWTINSLNDWLQPDFVYSFMCVQRPREEICKASVFKKANSYFIIDEYLRVRISIICIYSS